MEPRSAAEDDVLSFPSEHWRQIWTNNPLERLKKEIQRRTDVVGISRNDAAVIRLVLRAGLNAGILARLFDAEEAGRREEPHADRHGVG